jgi:hypothetical protein
MFTEHERDELLKAMKDIAGVSIVIKDRDTMFEMPMFTELTDRKAFFGKAKLWHVICDIIEVIFLEKLIAGELKFKKSGYIITVRERRDDGDNKRTYKIQ